MGYTFPKGNMFLEPFMRRWLTGCLLAVSGVSLIGCTTPYDAGVRALEAGNATKAEAKLKKAARSGEGKAQYKLGLLYHDGRGGVDRSTDEAEKWLVKAANNGIDDATIFRKAYGGDRDAQYQLGLRYHPEIDDGLNGPAYRIAHRWFKRAAANGEPRAQPFLNPLSQAEAGKYAPDMAFAVDLYQGRGPFQKRSELGAFWFWRSARVGDAGAAANLAQAYRQGQGVAQSRAQAVKWYRKAAEAGVPEAQHNYATLLLDGGEDSEPQPNEAAQWLRKAAESGYAPAANDYGTLLLRGHGVERAPSKARSQFRQAAEAGIPIAQSHLGHILLTQEGGSRKPEEGAEWLQKAAGQDVAAAQYRLAQTYISGTGVAQSAETAIRWLRRAAEAEYPPAMNRLGVAYTRGYGVSADSDKARRWFSQAAEAGNASAQDNLEALRSRGW